MGLNELFVLHPELQSTNVESQRRIIMSALERKRREEYLTYLLEAFRAASRRGMQERTLECGERRMTTQLRKSEQKRYIGNLRSLLALLSIYDGRTLV